MVTVSLLSNVDEHRHAFEELLRRYSVEFSHMKVCDFDSKRFHRTDADITVVDLTCGAVAGHDVLIDEVAKFDNVLFLSEELKAEKKVQNNRFTKELINKIGSVFGKTLEWKSDSLLAPFTWIICGGVGASESYSGLFDKIGALPKNDVFLVNQQCRVGNYRHIKRVLEKSVIGRSISVCTADRNITNRSVYLLPSGYSLNKNTDSLFFRVNKDTSEVPNMFRQTIEAMCNTSAKKRIGLIVLSGGGLTALDSLKDFESSIDSVFVQSEGELVIDELAKSARLSGVDYKELPLKAIAQHIKTKHLSAVHTARLNSGDVLPERLSA